jgi:hypothetical protein
VDSFCGAAAMKAPQAHIDSMNSLRHPEGRLPKARAEACWNAALDSQRDPPTDFRPTPPPRDLPAPVVSPSAGSATEQPWPTTITPHAGADRLATLVSPDTAAVGKPTPGALG